MRVPDLDWPTDLFADAVIKDERCANDATHVDASLWPVMREVWTRAALAAERPSLAA